MLYARPQAAPSFIAQCRTQRGSLFLIRVLDLSITGCLIERRGIGIAEGERFLIRLPGLTYLPSEILWVEGEEASLAFEQPLHEAVYMHLVSSILDDEHNRPSGSLSFG